MEMAKMENKEKSVISHQESSNQESSQSESFRQVGNAKISEKTSSFQSEQTAQVVEKIGTDRVSKVMQNSFASTKEQSVSVVDAVNEVVAVTEPKVNELIKSFEENQLAPTKNVVKTEVEIALKEANNSSSKALELINKFIDVPEPETVLTEPEKEIRKEQEKEVGTEPEKEIRKEQEKKAGKEPEKEVSDMDPIDIEMRELSKEIEVLKKEEERCKKSYVTRQTSTSSLEEAFVRRLEERRYKNVQEVLADSLPPLFKVKRPESLPPGNLIHLLRSVQIAQELNSVLKQASKVDGSSSADAKGVEDDSSGRENKPIDLEKLFTPATDSGEVTPSRSRKMYASSSFYSPFHPTVEDQVELARRISSSLCDISNKQSKGQSMYVNRMKRSVKWVHGGDENESQENTYSSTNEESSILNYNVPNYGSDPPKNPLKLVMNPHGKVQDLNSLTQQGLIIQPPLSPELCFDLVKDLNTTKGKGAELFAKRRKKSEKWVVDENTVRQTSSLQRQTSQMSTEKAMNLSNIQREQQMQKIQEIKGRINQPKLKLVKSPWDAALETGSVDAAFQEMPSIFPEPPISWTAKISESSTKSLEPRKTEPKKYKGSRSDLYLPNIPKGWTSPQFGGSLYGYSKTEKSGSSAAPRSALSEVKTNTIQTKLPFFDSTPKSVLKKTFTNQAQSKFKFYTSQKSNLAGKKKETGDALFKEKEQKVKFLEESETCDSLVKKNFEIASEKRVTVVEKELKFLQKQIDSIEEEIDLKKLEQSANETLKEVVNPVQKQLTEENEKNRQKSKPAALVIGAVPLFKGLEDVATKTNLLLHKELQSKLPGKKQKDKKKMSQKTAGKMVEPQPTQTKITFQHYSQQKPDKYCPDGKKPEPMKSQMDQHRIKEKSLPVPQVSVLQTLPVIDSMTTFSSQTQQNSKLWDFSSWNNYNTAPRGWKQNLNYYRPVTFTPSYKLPGSTYYTDY